ncbi:MAG: NAD(P)-binding protein [Rhodoferax sp.]|nr:NAD(P)-binding protein [Rhodoferax sp.]
MQHITTDYLIIGSGTAGLAFADTLIAESDAHVTIIDRHGKPGGHWNDAYSFVTLHQPSAFYGVGSMELGNGRIDSMGTNKGLLELASGPEVCGYFDRVMNHKLLPTGRVSYHPMCNYLGDGQFESLLSGQRTQVTVRCKLVDANHFGPKVPSTHRPRFTVAAGVKLVPPNALPQLWHGMGGADAAAERPQRFVIVGAGKTAMDTVIWLVNAGASPDAIRWVVPRDSWLINRETTQPGMAFFTQVFGSQADQMEAFATAASTSDLFLRLEACGALLRIFPGHEPSMFHLATVAPGEVEVLRSILNVIRLGRVIALEADHMQLERGNVPVQADHTLYVDCTASAVEPRAPQKIFQEGKIVLQLVRLPQPAFSAALTAYVEAHYADDAEKNRLCATVPFPHTLNTYARAMLVNMMNQHQWGQDKALRNWIRNCRLDGFGRLMAEIDPADTEKMVILLRLKEQAAAAVGNLRKLAAASV